MERLSLPTPDRASGISYLRQMSVGDTYPLHTHDFYEVFYVVRGRAMHLVNGENQCCTAGTLALMRPSDAHAYSFINQWDMELISIGISRDVLAAALGYIGMEESRLTDRPQPPCLLLTGPAMAVMASDLERLGSLREPGARCAFGKAMLARLLIGLTRDGQPAPVLPDWLSQLLDEMSQPDNFIPGLSRMLALSPVSQCHLNREMKRCLSMTPTAFINARRIALAGDLLLTGQYTSLEVSQQCGFETLSHFHENFRKVYGCAPKAFLAQHHRKETVTL